MEYYWMHDKRFWNLTVQKWCTDKIEVSLIKTLINVFSLDTIPAFCLYLFVSSWQNKIPSISGHSHLLSGRHVVSKQQWSKKIEFWKCTLFENTVICNWNSVLVDVASRMHFEMINGKRSLDHAYLFIIMTWNWFLSFAVPNFHVPSGRLVSSAGHTCLFLPFLEWNPCVFLSPVQGSQECSQLCNRASLLVTSAHFNVV